MSGSQIYIEEKKLEEKTKKDNPVYSETAYDDAFRTMEGKCDDLLIPFVSHMFDENYDSTAEIKRYRNEHYVEHEDGSEEKRVTDSYFDITCKDVTKRYHLECESRKYDGTILVRLFEYDTQIAKDTSEKNIYKARFRFPNTGVLLLRTSKETPGSGRIEIIMPDGREVDYDVPFIKMADYEIEDIFREKLFMLIPFYIFNFESQLSQINDSEERIDELFEKYNDVFRRLEEEQKTGNLSALSYDAIIRLTYSVAYKLTMKQSNVQMKVGDVMGGKVLDLPGFKIYDDGKKEGKAEEREAGIEIFIKDKIEDEIPFEKIVSKLQKNYKLTEDAAREYVQRYASMVVEK